MGLLVRHVVGQVVPGRSHQDGEECEADEHGVEDVVGADRQPLPVRLEDVAGVAVKVSELHLMRRDHCGSGPFAFDPAHIGSEMPCARMSRKCTYISSVMRAGRTNTWMVKKRCSVGGPTTGPPCSTSRMNAPSCAGGAEPAILIVTSVAK